MTKQQATEAMQNRAKVEAGKGDEHDTGYIHAINNDMAEIRWDSGVKTPCPIADLTIA